MSYVVEVPPGSDQDRTVKNAEEFARRFLPDVEINVHSGPLGRRRVLIRHANPEMEKRVADFLKHMLSPNLAEVRGGPTPPGDAPP